MCHGSAIKVFHFSAPGFFTLIILTGPLLYAIRINLFWPNPAVQWWGPGSPPTNPGAAFVLRAVGRSENPGVPVVIRWA